MRIELRLMVYDSQLLELLSILDIMAQLWSVWPLRDRHQTILSALHNSSSHDMCCSYNQIEKNPATFYAFLLAKKIKYPVTDKSNIIEILKQYFSRNINFSFQHYYLRDLRCTSYYLDNWEYWRSSTVYTLRENIQRKDFLVICEKWHREQIDILNNNPQKSTLIQNLIPQWKNLNNQQFGDISAAPAHLILSVWRHCIKNSTSLRCHSPEFLFHLCHTFLVIFILLSEYAVLSDKDLNL